MSPNSKDDRIDEILKLVQQISLDNASRDAEQKRIVADVLSHKLAIEGNGKPGLKMDVEILKDSQRRTNILAMVLGTFLVTEVGGLLWAILTHSVDIVSR